MGCMSSAARDEAGGRTPNVKPPLVIEQPTAVLENARTNLDTPVLGVILRPMPAIEQPKVLVERALVAPSQQHVNARKGADEVPFAIDVALDKPSLLTEVEVTSDRGPRRPLGLEVVVEGNVVAKGTFPSVAAHSDDSQPSRLRMRLDPAVDDVKAISVRVVSADCVARGVGLVHIDDIIARGLPAGSPSPLRRVASPPPYWQTIEGTGHSRIDVLDRDHIAVFQKLLDDTWKERHTRDRVDTLPRRLLVRKVQRVEAPTLWNTFVRHRRQMSTARRGAACTPITSLYGSSALGQVRTRKVCAASPAILGPCEEKVNENYLFHGTSPAAALGIIKDGFDVTRAGERTGMMFGPGAYFAEASSKFDEYARPDEFSGLCAVLVCRVLCGEMFRTLGQLGPDAVADPKFRDTYDGILGDREASVGTYREFVVFRQEQVYPEYVVFYDREFK